MGGWISKALSGPITDVMQAAGDIIGKFVTSPEQKLQAQLELSKLEADFRVKTMDADMELVKAQAEVVVSETKSQSWLARNWRPILMLTFTYIIAHNYVFAPLFSLKSVLIPEQMWELLKIGMGGYIVSRSAEKLVPDVVKALKK